MISYLDIGRWFGNPDPLTHPSRIEGEGNTCPPSPCGRELEGEGLEVDVPETTYFHSSWRPDIIGA